MHDAILSTPFGPISIHASVKGLVRIEFLTKAVKPTTEDKIPSQLKPVINALNRYFKKPQVISLPYELGGTPFQQKVWQALLQIPLGETRTYGDLAKKLKTSARAIGMACRTNPIPLVIPCHRIVGKGNLGGFAGDTSGKLINIKQWLLRHEGVML